MRDYNEAVEEFGPEFAEAVLQEEYNQFVRGIERPAAFSFYPFDASDDFPGYIETIGIKKVRAFDEELYLVAKEL